MHEEKYGVTKSSSSSRVKREERKGEKAESVVVKPLVTVIRVEAFRGSSAVKGTD